MSSKAGTFSLPWFATDWAIPENIHTYAMDSFQDFQRQGGGGGFFELEFQRHGGILAIGIPKEWGVGTDECASECSLKTPFHEQGMDATNQ